MRKNFGVKPWVYPQPVLMIGTYDENGKPNLMNAAWGGQYDANQVMLCLSSHKTTDNIKVTAHLPSALLPLLPLYPATMWGSSPQSRSQTKWRKRASRR